MTQAAAEWQRGGADVPAPGAQAGTQRGRRGQARRHPLLQPRGQSYLLAAGAEGLPAPRHGLILTVA